MSASYAMQCAHMLSVFCLLPHRPCWGHRCQHPVVPTLQLLRAEHISRQQQPVCGNRVRPPACSRHRMTWVSLSVNTSAGQDMGCSWLLRLSAMIWLYCWWYRRFPWWPAIVMPQSAAAAEPAPSADTAQQARSAGGGSKALVCVRFLGTHDTAWLGPGKVSPWPVQLGERSSKTKAAAFVNALKEGRVYAATGDLLGW
jgi:hypothetical protein